MGGSIKTTVALTHSISTVLKSGGWRAQVTTKSSHALNVAHRYKRQSGSRRRPRHSQITVQMSLMIGFMWMSLAFLQGWKSNCLLCACHSDGICYSTTVDETVPDRLVKFTSAINRQW